MLRNKIIGKFTGKANDYERFKAVFYPNVHVQREPVYLKAAALDSLIEPEVREEVFGVGLGNSEHDYAERLERLERMYGGEDRIIDLTLNRIKGLRLQSRRDYGKLRELVNTIHFFVKGAGSGDANSVSLREQLHEGMPPALLKRYMEETAERGYDDTLSHMLEWTYRYVKMHFKHKAFEELQEKKPKPVKAGAKKAQAKGGTGEAFAFPADSEATTSSAGEEVAEVRYQTQEACPQCQGSHPLYKCEKFYNLLPLKRRQLLQKRGLCLVCYSSGHEARECKFTTYKCRFGCKSRHNSDVHLTAEDYQTWSERSKAPPRDPVGPEAELANLVYSMDAELQGESEEVCYPAQEEEALGPTGTLRGLRISQRNGLLRPDYNLETERLGSPESKSFMARGDEASPTGPWRYRHTAVTTLLVEVINPHNGRSERAYTMADTGASNTHVSSSLGRKLGLRGILAPFVVGSHGGRVQEYEVMECQLQIGSVDGFYRRDVPAKCYPNPCGQMEAVDWKKLQADWAHLRHLPLPAPIPNRKVELIIGTDCLDAIEAIAPVVFREKGDPCAKLTRLGWIIGGRTAPRPTPGISRAGPENPLPNHSPSQAEGARCGFVREGRRADLRGDLEVNPEVGNFCGFMREITPDTLEAEWEIEGPERSRELANSFSPKRLTALEAKAVTLFKKGLSYQDKRYRVPLLWKDDSRPRDNYPEAK